MRNFYGIFSVFFILFCLPVFASGEELKGYVRSINYQGHSFSVDVPPLQRVWVFPQTVFDSGNGYAGFRSLQEGDYVSVDGSVQSNGLFTAKKVKKMEQAAGEIKLDKPFLLDAGQTLEIQSDGIKLKGIEIVDTLCKDGYYCEGEGSIGMKILVTKGGKKKEILLSSKGTRKPPQPIRLEAVGYFIELVEMGESSAIIVVRRK